MNIQEFIQKNNLPKYRTAQYFQHMYKDLVESFDDFHTWPKDLREKANQSLNFNSLEEVKSFETQNSNTVKKLFELKSTGKKIETVLMKHDDGRNTICVSCMVGCPVNCKFCATGKMGFNGNLTEQEIVDQVLHFARILKKENQKVTNVVYMGMGEPMLNLENVKNSILLLTDSDKFALSQRRITVSTSGYVPQFKKFIEWGYRGRVAISLHAPNQELRAKLMPVARQFPLEKLMEVLDEYVELTNKRISYEYILIKNVNDTPAHADDLIKLLKNRLAHVNLIPYNPIKEEEFDRPEKSRIFRFSAILSKAGINNTIRVTMGDEVKAACGQLASNN